MNVMGGLCCDVTAAADDRHRARRRPGRCVDAWRRRAATSVPNRQREPAALPLECGSRSLATARDLRAKVGPNVAAGLLGDLVQHWSRHPRAGPALGVE
jgi:hypothetical protein